LHLVVIGHRSAALKRIVVRRNTGLRRKL
jgi:hypothetical protein